MKKKTVQLAEVKKGERSVSRKSATSKKTSSTNMTKDGVTPRRGYGNTSRNGFQKTPKPRPHVPLTDAAERDYIKAKCFPGWFDSPIIAADSILSVPTSTFSTGLTINTCAVDSPFDTNSAALGTKDYLVIAYACSATFLVGAGGSGYAVGTKLGGLQVLQDNSSSTKILYLDGFDRPNRSKSFIQAYNSDITGLGSQGYIWASQLWFSLLAPAANITGKCWKGRLAFGQLPSAGLSASQLISLATETESVRDFSLSTALVNNNLIFESGVQDLSGNATTPDFNLEYVEYVVLLKPSVNITTGANSSFSLNIQISGNFVWLPTSSDVFIKQVGDKIAEKEQDEAQRKRAASQAPQANPSTNQIANMRNEALRDFSENGSASNLVPEHRRDSSGSFISDTMRTVGNTISETAKKIISAKILSMLASGLKAGVSKAGSASTGLSAMLPTAGTFMKKRDPDDRYHDVDPSTPHYVAVEDQIFNLTNAIKYLTSVEGTELQSKELQAVKDTLNTMMDWYLEQETSIVPFIAPITSLASKGVKAK